MIKTARGKRQEEERQVAADARREQVLAEDNPEITAAVQARVAEIAEQEKRNKVADLTLVAQQQLAAEKKQAAILSRGQRAVLRLPELLEERRPLIARLEQAMVEIHETVIALAEVRAKMLGAARAARDAKLPLGVTLVPYGLNHDESRRLRIAMLDLQTRT